MAHRDASTKENAAANKSATTFGYPLSATKLTNTDKLPSPDRRSSRSQPLSLSSVSLIPAISPGSVQSPTMSGQRADEVGRGTRLVIRNPFPWTCQRGQTTRPRVFSRFSVRVSEIATEMKEIRGRLGIAGDDVSKPEAKRRGHRHKGELGDGP